MAARSFTLDQLFVAARLRQHRDEIIKHLNSVELEPGLRERSMLNVNDRSYLRSERRRKQKAEYIVQCVEKRGLSLKFLESVRNEKAHCGHEYVAALLEGREYCSASDRRKSEQIRRRIESNMTRMMDIDLSSLVPRLLSRRLLTNDEMILINGSKVHVQKENILLFYDIMETKGPLAYLKFVQCLSEDKSHQVHSELYELLSGDSQVELAEDELALVSKRQPNRLVMEGALVGDEYNQLIAKFKVYHHNGDWVAVEEELKICMQSEIPEIIAVGFLEDACSWVYRFNEQKVLSAIGQARKLCGTKICGGNAIFLEARAEYILSGLYRYLKQYEKSVEHAKNAMVHLFNAEQGEDSAFANYNHACASYSLMLESRQETSVTIRQMMQDFTFAIDTASAVTHAASTSDNQWALIVASHSWIRLAMLSLGSTQDAAGITEVQEDIERADCSLSNVNVSCLNNRTKCLFYQAKSDLHRNKKETECAIQVATQAQELAESCGFVHELDSANSRLESLNYSKRAPSLYVFIKIASCWLFLAISLSVLTFVTYFIVSVHCVV